METILDHQKTSASMTNSQHCPAVLHPMNHIPGTRDQHNSVLDHPLNPQLTSHPLSLKFDTFWTMCNRCRTQYEYKKLYRNRKLLCHHCQQPFMAIDMPTLSANVCSSRPFPAPYAALKDSRSLPASSFMPTEITTMLQSSGQRVKGGAKEAVNMARSNNALEKNTAAPEKVDASSAFNAGSPRLKEEKSSIKRQIDSPKSTNEGSRMTAGRKSGRKRMLANSNRNFGAERVVSSSSNKPKGLEELSHADIRRMMMEKARTEIIRELNK